jgi:hypothetical protein
MKGRVPRVAASDTTMKIKILEKIPVLAWRLHKSKEKGGHHEKL